MNRFHIGRQKLARFLFRGGRARRARGQPRPPTLIEAPAQTGASGGQQMKALQLTLDMSRRWLFGKPK